MLNKVKLKYGFSTTTIDEIGSTFHSIKLRFADKNLDPQTRALFTSLGFTSRWAKKDCVIYVFHTTDYTVYDTTGKQVREYLIRKKISRLYEKLAEISPTLVANKVAEL